ncbi:MAG TPA: cation transporter [Methylophilaceae bacterium]|nr:cation transporter [Methylophilaceae bacterium]
MKKLLICMFVAILNIDVAPIYANDAHHQVERSQKSYSAKGEVVSIDNAAGKIKLQHEAVSELKWPGMTMFFNVADKALLDTVKTGDQVEFEFVKVDGSGPSITKIKPIK